MQYAQELKEYQQTEAYQITSAKIQDKRIKKGDNRAAVIYVMLVTHACVVFVFLGITTTSPGQIAR